MSTCIAAGLLEGYRSGEAPEEQRRFVEQHCAVCDDCRLLLEVAAFAEAPEDPEELAAEVELLARINAARPIGRLVQELMQSAEAQPSAAAQQSGAAQESRADAAQPGPRREDRRPSRWSTRGKRWTVAVGGAVAAAVVVLSSSTTRSPPAFELQSRAAEGRPALVKLEHVPYVPLRGEDRDPPEYDRALGWLLSRPASEQATTSRYLAALYLWRGEKGDRTRAEAALRSSPESGRRDNDIGVLLLAGGEAEGALLAFSAALEKEPELIEAHFNRGLALEAMGRRAEAVEAWEAYLGRAGTREEEAWLDEARRHRDALLQDGDAASE